MEQTARIREFPYKLLIFVLYGESDLPYIRRHNNRFIVETKPTCQRFDVKSAYLRRTFGALAKAGYIYNLSSEAGRVRFYVNFPRYLTFNKLAAESEQYVAESRVPAGGYN